MYEKGLVQVITPPCEEMEEGSTICDPYLYGVPGHVHFITDSRSRKTFNIPCAFLPHSCDEWVIGGMDEVNTLIEDLKILLEEMKR